VITPSETHRKPYVILAEDNADLREVLGDVLVSLGAEVEAVADGGRFLVCIASQYNDGHTPERVNLIITDVGMPVCSGFDILDAIRAAGWTTPAIIMTGSKTSLVSTRAAKLQATLLIKPITLETFESTVIDLLGARPVDGGEAQASTRAAHDRGGGTDGS